MVIGSAGLAVGLLGIVLLYLAAVPGPRRGLRPALHRAGAGSRDRCPPTLTKAAFALVDRRFRDQGRPGTDACLASGRPLRGPEPDQRDALRARSWRRPSTPSSASGRSAEGAAGTTYVRTLLLVFGALSLLLAALFALRQANYKRLLAYSSIEHMGIVSLGDRDRRSDRRLRGVPPRPRPRGRQEPCLLRRRGAAESLRVPFGSGVRGVMRVAPSPASWSSPRRSRSPGCRPSASSAARC